MENFGLASKTFSTWTKRSFTLKTKITSMNEELNEEVEGPQKPLIRQKMDFLDKEIAQLTEEIRKFEVRLKPLLEIGEATPREVDIEKEPEIQSLANQIQRKVNEIEQAKHKIVDIRERLEI